MNKFKISTLSAVLLSATAFVPAAQADLSANVGLVSDYVFRGITQTGAASGSAGVDYENGGFYLGTWAADVQDGLEVDVYAGYGIETESGLSLSAGFTTYQYTGDFDSSYNEINLGLGYGAFSLEVSKGVWEVEGGDDQDYTFIGLTAEAESGLYGTLGFHGGDFDGSYVEVGYGMEVGGFDTGVAIIAADSDLGGDETLVFSISKSFDL
ncbi:TorF family putative porin [Alteromonadaceae bacterium BrNp21-10]|nr:TorF family putative porin [Alteromonadaceae bacterium BrNp21-10]